jgi:hypothetical protein
MKKSRKKNRKKKDKAEDWLPLTIQLQSFNFRLYYIQILIILSFQKKTQQLPSF